MAKVLFKRYETDAEAQASNIIDGQFIVTKEGTSYTDYGTDRVAFGGTLDTQMSDSSINGVQNKVIKAYVDNEVSDGVQEVKDYVDEKQTYSTEETVIGTWLNKPLYRKVIDFGTLPNNTSKYVNHNISNVDYFTNVRVMGYGGSNNSYPIPFMGLGWMFSEGKITARANLTQVGIATDNDFTTHTAYIVLEYIKTTD